MFQDHVLNVVMYCILLLLFIDKAGIFPKTLVRFLLWWLLTAVGYFQETYVSRRQIFIIANYIDRTAKFTLSTCSTILENREEEVNVVESYSTDVVPHSAWHSRIMSRWRSVPAVSLMERNDSVGVPDGCTFSIHHIWRQYRVVFLATSTLRSLHYRAPVGTSPAECDYKIYSVLSATSRISHILARVSFIIQVPELYTWIFIRIYTRTTLVTISLSLIIHELKH